MKCLIEICDLLQNKFASNWKLYTTDLNCMQFSSSADGHRDIKFSSDN